MRWFRILICWCLLSPAFAQIPAYLHFGVSDGLPSNLVYTGTQDRNGLLWFGTDKGLSCFDGHRFHSYTMADGLPDPEVLGLIEDKTGRLWLGCFNQVPCYRENRRFVTSREDDVLRKLKFSTGIFHITEKPDSSLWFVGHESGFYRLHRQVVDTFLLPSTVLHVGQLGEDWVAVSAGGIYRMDSEDHLNEVLLFGTELYGVYFGAAFSGNRLLLAAENRMVLFEYRDRRLVELASYDSLGGGAYTDRAGRFWAYSKAKGVVCFDNDRRDLSNPVALLAGKKVSHMFEDNQGTFWFCTMENGLYALPQFAPVNYTLKDKLPSNNITALARDHRGRLYAGDDQGNITCFDGQSTWTKSFGAIDGLNKTRQILPMPDGSLWLVMDDNLVHLHDRKNYREIQTRNGWKAVLPKPDKIWVASSSYLGYSIDFQVPVRLPGGRSTALTEDDQGYVWAGRVEGLYSLRDNFKANWGDSFPDLKGKVVLLQYAGPGRLWAATPRTGLLLLFVKNGQVTGLSRINKHLANPLYNIQSLFQAADGRLWLATNTGVYGLDTTSWRIDHYDSHNGLADDDVNTVLVYQDTLWAGSGAGLSRVLLRATMADQNFFTLVTTLRYQRRNQPVEVRLLDTLLAEPRLVLPADASLVELELAGLDYRSRGNIRFECLVTPSLPPWRWWTLDNLLTRVGRAFGSNPTDTLVVEGATLGFGVELPAGAYQLQITAISTGDLRSNLPARWTVVMRPHWYSTIWTMLLLWAVVGLIIWRVWRARAAYREMNAAVSELQLQTLQSQINPHFIGNTINAFQQFFYPPDPVRASEYVEIFSGLLRRTMRFSERRFISFAEELTYDREYLQMIQLRFGDRFQYEITGADQVPPQTPFPSMLLQPLLENATIHGLAEEGLSMLSLDFHWKGEQLCCILTDNGPGILETKARKEATRQERKSRGMELLEKKVYTLNRLHHLDMALEVTDLSTVSKQGRGTRVRLCFRPGQAPELAPLTRLENGQAEELV